MTRPPVPPNGATPDLDTDLVDTLRRWLTDTPTRHHIVTAEPISPAWAIYGATDDQDPAGQAFPVRTWTIQKAAGPAPFIGDPTREAAWHEWHVAVSDGDQVAGDSHLVIISADTRLDRTAWRRWELAEYGSAS